MLVRAGVDRRAGLGGADLPKLAEAVAKTRKAKAALVAFPLMDRRAPFVVTKLGVEADPLGVSLNFCEKHSFKINSLCQSRPDLRRFTDAEWTVESTNIHQTPSAE